MEKCFLVDITTSVCTGTDDEKFLAICMIMLCVSSSFYMILFKDLSLLLLPGIQNHYYTP